MNRRLFLLETGAFVVTAYGCGGDNRNPVGPDIDPTTVAVKDLETAVLIPDADVRVSRSITEAYKGGYRDRKTKTASEITMFPTGPGFDDLFLDQLLFNEFVPGRRLSRPKGPVFVVLGPGARKLARSAEKATGFATDLSVGKIPFSLVSDVSKVPAGAVMCEVNLKDAPTGYLGYASNKFDTKTGYIIYSEVVIDPDYLNLVAESWQYLGHEFGHVMGLGHSDQFGLMTPRISLKNKDYSEAEKRATRLACLRPVGTASPDDDSAIPYQGVGTTFSIGVGFKENRKDGTARVDILCADNL